MHFRGDNKSKSAQLTHFIRFTYIESLCYTPETNIMLNLNYISIKKKQRCSNIVMTEGKNSVP